MGTCVQIVTLVGTIPIRGMNYLIFLISILVTRQSTAESDDQKSFIGSGIAFVVKNKAFFIRIYRGAMAKRVTVQGL